MFGMDNEIAGGMDYYIRNSLSYIEIALFICFLIFGFIIYRRRFIIPYLLLIDIIGWWAWARISQEAQRAHALLVGGQLIIFTVIALIKWNSNQKFTNFRIKPSFENKLIAFFLIANILATLIGYADKNKLIFIVGDSYKLLVIPLAYFLVITTMEKSDIGYLMGWTVVAHFGGAMVLISQRLMSAINYDPVRFGGPNLLPLIYFMLLSIHHDRRRRILYLLCALINLLIILLTFSRRAVLSIVIIILLVLATEKGVGKLTIGLKRTLSFGLICVLTLIGIMIMTEYTGWGRVLIKDINSKVNDTYTLGVREESASYRLSESWKTIENYKKSDSLVRWVIGFGNGAEYVPEKLDRQYAKTNYLVHNIHNTYATVFFRMGILGLILFIMFIVSTSWYMIRLLRIKNGLSDRERDIVRVIFIMFITTVLVENNTIFTFIGDMYWGILFGIIGLLLKKQVRNNNIMFNNKVNKTA